MKATCGRIHLGPVAVGTVLCRGCGKMLTYDERVTYWEIRKQTLIMMRDALRHSFDYLVKKRQE